MFNKTTLEYKRPNNKIKKPNKKIAGYAPTPNHESNSTFAVFDIESPEQHADGAWIYKVGMVKYMDRVERCDTIQELIEACKRIPLGVPIYAHNLDFDMLFFMQQDEFMKGVLNTPIIASGNMTIAINFGAFELRNSLALFPMALSKVVSKFLGIDDQEYQQNKKNVLNLDDETLLGYLYKDCDYLQRAINKYKLFIYELIGQDISYTTAATALKVYRHKFQPCKETIFNETHRKKFFSENYYYGGHSEKFISGQYVFRHVHYYDVNSLYPFIMQGMYFGESEPTFKTPRLETLLKLLKAGHCFYAEVDLCIMHEDMRFFPVLKDGINKYPLGTHKIKMSEIGVKFLRDNGWIDGILKVRCIIDYGVGTVKPFVDYVDTFYAIRKAQPEYNEVAKLLLNSLYGKFAEKEERRTKYINFETPEGVFPISSTKTAWGSIDTYNEPAPFYKRGDHRLDIAGKITEAARLHVAQIIIDIRKAGFKVIYTDTDSIITDAHLESVLPHLVDDKRLGALKNELPDRPHNMILLGVKMYAFYGVDKIASKGLKGLTLDNFREIIRGKHLFFNKRFSRLHTLVNRGFFGIQLVPHDIKTLIERLD